MKIGKEYILPIYDNYNVSIGTVDFKKPQTIYICISGWVNPKSKEDINYSRVISKINHEIKSFLFINNCNHFNNQIIVDLNLRESGIKYNKKSYMCCEITLYQKHDFLPFLSDDLKNILHNKIKKLIDKVFEDNKYFTFHNTKK